MGAMNYPSTTQALFALIVMIIVLLFILVYCCWGTFSCARNEDTSHAVEDGAAVVREIQGPGGRGHRMVIVPFSNMIYVGDPESRRIYEIPVEQDKPPAYTEVFDNVPPPPYSTRNRGSDTSSNSNSNNASNARVSLPDLPPSYDDCFSSSVDNKWPEVLEAILSEQAKRELEQQSSNTHFDEPFVTQLPALRLPSTLLMQNDILSTAQARRSLAESMPISPEVSTNQHTEPERSPSQDTSNQTMENEQANPSTVTNLLDLWAPPPPFQDQPEWNQNVNNEGTLLTASLPPPFTVSPNEDQIVTSEEDSVSSATDDELISSPSTSTTSSSSNENQETNVTQTQSENSHSTQDYSKV
ncbi:rho GTPase-activating protein gacII-like isoform X2 [Macrobrachium rosenbergii]|uniref:rho GTPase-activating protein gacII-like isoform X2 n=1 Tax=Macrobrachium rosenbergii TaxID=79674 RepID=UPI0034D6DDEA